jgi:hypothetical protein
MREKTPLHSVSELLPALSPQPVEV